MKRIAFSLLLALSIISCGMFTRKNAPQDIKKAQHFVALFYDQIMAGNRDAAVDSMCLDIINASEKKALNVLHSQYGTLTQISVKKTNTLVRKTDNGNLVYYDLIVTETYGNKTIDSYLTIDNVTGKLKISGYNANISEKQEKDIWKNVEQRKIDLK